jgi:glycosyltransferase involved in cell wall biosynthesis
MAESPHVSVIMIFLNAAAFLEEAIASVFAQTYPHWELLLVDDGSTDASTAIAQHWSGLHPGRVRYLEHPGHANLGMSASRNRGLLEAHGRFIALLDADDVWLPRKLSEQLTVLEAQPRAAMVYGRSELWWSWTGRVEDQERDHMLPLGVPADTLVEPPTLLRLLVENKVQTPTTCNVLLRRALCESVGGFQDDFRGMFEDQVFFAKVCLEFPVYVSGTCWARYRQHPQSCCALASAQGSDRADRLRFLRWLKAYFAERRVSHAGLREALKRELWPLEHPLLVSLSKTWRRTLRRIRNRVPWLAGRSRDLPVQPGGG